MQVLIVEDHRMLGDGLRLLLEREFSPVSVAVAADTAAARSHFAGRVPDVALVDFNLPGEDGISLARWIRRHSPTTKVLVMSGTLSKALVRGVLQAGAHGFVAKEAAGKELVAAIRDVRAGETYLSPKAATVLAESIRTGTDAGVELSAQEREVLRGVARGLTFKEIAQGLGISPRTVETYRVRLARKTGCRTKVALARFAMEESGILGPDTPPA